MAPDTSAVPSEPIRPVPPAPPLPPEKVALGRQLFYEQRLSRDGTVSCATCHDVARAGVDGRPVPRGIGGALGVRNAPTVFNATLNVRLLWDGRARTLAEQIDQPIHDEREMGSSWPEVVERLGAEGSYREAFVSVYGRPPDAEGVRDAIATFERSLMAVGSRFDRYLGGDERAISDDEKAGYRLFKSYGCSACHQGANVGGNMFARLGEAVPLPDRLMEDMPQPLRVPPLRLVALTAPYFHDGTVATLDDAIRRMGDKQLGRVIPPGEREQIAAFLTSLAPPGLAAGGSP